MPTLTIVLRSLASALILVAVAASAAHATTAPPVPVPEPGLLALLGSAVASAVLYARNRR